MLNDDDDDLDDYDGIEWMKDEKKFQIIQLFDMIWNDRWEVQKAEKVGKIRMGRRERV